MKFFSKQKRTDENDDDDDDDGIFGSQLAIGRLTDTHRPTLFGFNNRNRMLEASLESMISTLIPLE